MSHGPPSLAGHPAAEVEAAARREIEFAGHWGLDNHGLKIADGQRVRWPSGRRRTRGRAQTRSSATQDADRWPLTCRSCRPRRARRETARAGGRGRRRVVCLGSVQQEVDGPLQRRRLDPERSCGADEPAHALRLLEEMVTSRATRSRPASWATCWPWVRGPPPIRDRRHGRDAARALRRARAAEPPHRDPYDARERARRRAAEPQWTAELARIDGERHGRHWARAAASWDRLSPPHDAAYCRWRAAQVALREGAGHRGSAAAQAGRRGCARARAALPRPSRHRGGRPMSALPRPTSRPVRLRDLDRRPPRPPPPRRLALPAGTRRRRRRLPHHRLQGLLHPGTPALGHPRAPRRGHERRHPPVPRPLARRLHPDHGDRPAAPRIAGRRTELAAVRRHLETGTGLLLVTGEAGIGKTTLVTAAAAGQPTAFVAAGHCLPLSTEVPLLPVIDVPARPCSTADDGHRFAEALAGCPPYVRGVAGPPAPRAGRRPGGALADEFVRQLLFTCGRRPRSARRGRAASALLLEDLHWADPSTLDLLEHLLRESARSRSSARGGPRTPRS